MEEKLQEKLKELVAPSRARAAPSLPAPSSAAMMGCGWMEVEELMGPAWK